MIDVVEAHRDGPLARRNGVGSSGDGVHHGHGIGHAVGDRHLPGGLIGGRAYRARSPSQRSASRIAAIHRRSKRFPLRRCWQPRQCAAAGSRRHRSGSSPQPPCCRCRCVILMSARELQPNKVTAAMFCCGSMATPEGCGVGQAALLTSTLCSTVKSSALVTLPLKSATSSANRRAEVSRLDGTVAVSWRSPLPTQEVVQRLAVEADDQTRRPVRASESLADDGQRLRGRARSRCRAIEVVTNVFGLVSVMENV